jgi:hypothetical protein
MFYIQKLFSSSINKERTGIERDMADLVVGLLLSKRVKEKVLQAKAAWEGKKARHAQVNAQAEVLYGRGFKNIAFSTAEKIIRWFQEHGIEPAIMMDDPSRGISENSMSIETKEKAFISRSVLIACRAFFEASEFIEIGEFKQWIKEVAKALPKGIDADNFNFLKGDEWETRMVICKAFLDGIESLTSAGKDDLPWRHFASDASFRALFNIENESEQIEITFPGGKVDANAVDGLLVRALLESIKQEKKCILGLR